MPRTSKRAISDKGPAATTSPSVRAWRCASSDQTARATGSEEASWSSTTQAAAGTGRKRTRWIDAARKWRLVVACSRWWWYGPYGSIFLL